MRLNGKLEIMAHFGRSWRNKDGWRKVRVRYGEVIRCYPGSGHVWALSEELDAVDREGCVRMVELLAARVTKGEAVGEAVGGYPRELLKLVKRILKPPARGQG